MIYQTWSFITLLWTFSVSCVTDGSPRHNSSQQMRDVLFRASMNQRWKPRSRSALHDQRTCHPSRTCLGWGSLCQCKWLSYLTRLWRKRFRKTRDTFGPFSWLTLSWLLGDYEIFSQSNQRLFKKFIILSSYLHADCPIPMSNKTRCVVIRLSKINHKFLLSRFILSYFID